MSDEIPTGSVPQNLDALREEALEEHVLEDVAESKEAIDSTFELFITEHESLGFKFLEEHGAQAIQAFKLCEVALSTIGGVKGTDNLTPAEWSLLQQMLGEDFMEDASKAYMDCRDQTRHLEDMHNLDERTTWRLTEFIHLYENVMLYGQRTGRLNRMQAPRVLERLVHDFGEYFGLLVDDWGDSRRQTARRLARYLAEFRASEHFSDKLPVEHMTRLPLDDPLARELFHYEVARGIAPHPLLVKERTVRGDEAGNLDAEAPVEFVTHELDVHYALDLDKEDAKIVNAILPVFAVSVFDGFDSLPEVEEYISREQNEIRLHEQQCFALLQCLRHYDGKVPSRMKEFDAGDVMKAAQKVYREKAKANLDTSATTLRGMLKQKVSNVLQKARPIAFSWPENRSMYTIHGYPEETRFFPQHVSIGAGEEQENYTFLCHTHLDTDPDAEKPMMYEYQAVIGEGLLFDAHEAARDLFEDAPDTFKRTLDAGPLVEFAKGVIHPGEASPSLDMEEAKLLGTYVGLHGGMQSWLGQRYVLSHEGSDIFARYDDVKAYVGKLEAIE